ncbi:DUF1707 and DUF4870 domain-containing protein [Aestuariimicrobium ganziense]|uniref:DUF1707 and DUF4870 domain-containing protein n=1 Tax=Aestuariimicrobium ganziense TaxID=2773677 RepID=UPI0019440127|nr:DUF1707 and DUF4870 domain-containing protein [Aestuariimicrobium ganziense]
MSQTPRFPTSPTSQQRLQAQLGQMAFNQGLAHVTRSHPNLTLRVTEAQRDRALAYLQGAYADGRLSADELDHRIGQALVAETRAELNAAFSGLVQIPLSSAAVGAHPAYAPLVNQHRDGTAGRVTATLGHLSALGTSIVGPGLVYAVTAKDSYAKLEAAKAFNFQVTMLGLIIGSAIFLEWLPFHGALMALLGISWLVFTVVGGLRASNGEEWTNPINRVLPVRVLEDRPAHKRRPRR